MLHCREGFIPLTVGACGPSPSDACFRGVPAATRRTWSGLLQPSSIECNFMSQLTTVSRAPPDFWCEPRKRTEGRKRRVLLGLVGGTFMQVESTRTWDSVKLRTQLAWRKQRSAVLHTGPFPVLAHLFFAELLWSKHEGPPGTRSMAGTRLTTPSHLHFLQSTCTLRPLTQAEERCPRL